MINETEIYEELGRVPKLPEGLYDGIMEKINGRKRAARLAFAAAAALTLTIGTTALLLGGSRASAGSATELAGELETIHDYLNGNDLDQEFQSYAMYFTDD